MRDFLGGYEEQLREYAAREHDIVDQAILLWNVQTEAIARHRERRGSEWAFTRLEDFSRAPVERFRELFAHMNVCPGTTGSRRSSRSTSDPSNPAEASRPDSVRATAPPTSRTGSGA